MASFAREVGLFAARVSHLSLIHICRAFEQPRVDIKDIAGKRFATGRAAQQKREFAIGARVMGEVVVNLSLIHI